MWSPSSVLAGFSKRLHHWKGGSTCTSISCAVTNFGKWSAQATSTSIVDPFFCECLILNSLNRIQAQFDHLADTYFKDFDFDLGERELGLVLSLDHDLDVYASSMGLTKTAVESILDDEGGFSPVYTHFVDHATNSDIVRDLNGMDPGRSFLEPIQKSLDQCKSAKAVARWI